MFDETKDNQPVNQEPYNPYLSKEPYTGPTISQNAAERAAQDAARRAEQDVTGEAVQDATGQVAQDAVGQVTQNAAEQTAQDASGQAYAGEQPVFMSQGMSGQMPEEEKKTSSTKVISGVVIGIVVLLIIALIIIFAGLFKDNKKVVGEALVATFAESGEYLEEVWNTEAYEGMFESEEYTLESDFELPDSIGFELDILKNEDAMGFNADISMYGSSFVEIEGYQDDKEIVVALPELLDYAFYVDRETLEEDIWNLVDMDMITEEDAEMLIAANESEAETTLSKEAGEKLTEDVKNIIKTFFDECELVEVDSKELSVNGEKRDCDGYQIAMTAAQFAGVIEDIVYACEENEEVMEYLEAVSEGADYDIEEEFEWLHEECEEIIEENDEDDEYVLEFYLYDGKVAQIYVEGDGDTITWYIEGGNYPLENTSIYTEIDGEEDLQIVRTGSDTEEEYRVEYWITDDWGDETIFDVRYYKEDVEFEAELLENGDSLLFVAGGMEKEDESTLRISIDTLEMDEEEILSGDMVLTEGCGEIEMPEGEELNLLTLTEEDWYDILDELLMAFY